MLIIARPLHHFRLQHVVHPLHQLPAQRLQHHRRGDAVRQQVIQLLPHLEDLLRRALGNTVVGDLCDERFPVGGRDGRAGARLRVLRVDGLVHEQRAPQVAVRLVRDARVQGWDLLPVLLLACTAEDVADLGLGGRRDADEQRAAADRGDDACGGVGEEDEADVVGILFHGAAEGGLGVARQVVGFVDDDDFEALLRVEVDLLGLGDFFEEFLHDDSVVAADVGRGDFEVVDGGDDVEFELAVAGGLEDSGVDLDLFDAGAVEGAQGGEDAGLFACAGRAEEEEVGEVGR